MLTLLAAVPAAGQPPAPNPPAVKLPVPAEAPGRPSRGFRPATLTPAGPRLLDRHGDLLPAGAVARFGSVRLRHGGGLTGLGFTADAKALLSLAAPEDGFRVWDPATGKELARLNTVVQAAALAPDRSVLYVADGKARVWEPYAGGRVRELPPGTLPGEGVSALAFHPGGRVFAAATPKGIALIDLPTGEEKGTLRVPGDQAPLRIVFSPDGRWVAAAGPRTGVWLWNLATLRRVRTYPSPCDHLDFAFSPDGSRLAIAGGPLAVFHTDSEEPAEGFEPPETPVEVARFSADGKSLYALGPDGTLTRLDAATGQEKETWPAPEGAAPQLPLAVAANGAWVAAADDTGGIRVWNPRDGTGPDVERGSALQQAGFSADGTLASALAAGGKVVTFDPATGAPGKVFEVGTGDGAGVWWDSRSGLAVGFAPQGDDSEMHVVDVLKQKRLAKIALPAGDLPTVAFSPAGPPRVALFFPGTATVYDALTGRPLRSFDLGQSGGTRTGALSPDGRLVAAATNPVAVYEVATGRKRFELAGLADPLAVVFSPDGRRLAAAETGEVVVYDLRTGGLLRRLRTTATESDFTAVAFSPDGAHIATGGEDGVVTLWDVASGEALVAFDRHEGPVTSVAFSPDGRRLLSASLDGTALVWDTAARPAPVSPVAGADEAFGLLASPDAAAAQRGMAFLFRTPDAAVRLLGERVAVPKGVPAGRVARLVADLGSPEFATRQAAVKELGGIGAEAGPALRAVAAAPPNAEVRRLAGDLLARLAAPPTRPEDLLAYRAVELAEGIATPAARELLAKWAAGPAHHRLTTEADAALKRLRGPGSPE